MRFSILVPVLNDASVIGRCLNSIATQTYPDVEAVVSDGGSKDGTIGIIEQYQELMGSRLVWRSEPDQGTADAMNWAVTRASGDWMIMLGADDCLATPDVLSRAAIDLARSPPACRVLVGDLEKVDNSGKLVTLVSGWSLDDYRFLRDLELDVPFSRMIWHRSLFSDHGPFDTSLKLWNDRDFILRELKREEAIYVPGLTIATMRVGGLSTNRRYAIPLFLEYMRIYRRHVGSIPPVIYWRFVKACGISALFRLFGDTTTLRITNVYRRMIGNRPPLSY